MTPAEHREGRRWIWNGEDAGLNAVDPFDQYPADGEILVPADDKRVLVEAVTKEVERIERLRDANDRLNNPAAVAVTRAHQETAANLRAALDSVQKGERG